MKTIIIAITAFAVLGGGVAAEAAGAPEKCQAAKHKAAGTLAMCLQSAQSKLVKSGNEASYDALVAKCEATYSKKWQGAELVAAADGEACQTSGDEVRVGASIANNVACIKTALATGDTSCLLIDTGEDPICGNGALDAGEDCDFGVLGAATCSSETGGLKTLGSLSCDPGCVYDTSACSEGALVGGHEWFLGAADATSCDTICAAHSRVYDSATATYAGSGGTNENCQQVLLGLGRVASVADFDLGMVADAGLGCTFMNQNLGGSTLGIGLRVSNPPTVSVAVGSGFSGARRVCACM